MLTATLALAGCSNLDPSAPKPFRHLTEALRDGDLERAMELIAEGKQRGDYNPSLQVACVNHATNLTLLQNLPIIQALLDAGADPDAGKNPKDGFTPLWLMADSPKPGSEQALDMLIKAGAALDVQDQQHGMTPLMNAAERGAVSKVRRLLEAGADPAVVNHAGENALMRCATNCLPILVKAGLDVNAIVLSKNMKVLMWAAANGLDLKVQALLAHGAEVNAGSTAELRRKGGIVSGFGLTALMHAANGGHTKAARVLLDAGADVNATTFEGWSALMLATAGGHNETVRLLAERGARTTGMELGEFIHAVRTNDARQVRVLLQKGVSANLCNPFMRTPIEIASNQGFDEVLQVLIDAGADLSPRGEWALKLAEMRGHRSTAELLRKAMEDSRKRLPHPGSSPR